MQYAYARFLIRSLTHRNDKNIDNQNDTIYEFTEILTSFQIDRFQ